MLKYKIHGIRGFWRPYAAGCEIKRVFAMSFLNASGPKREVAQNIHEDHSAGYHPNLADLFRLRHMEKIFQQTADELKQVKTRLSRLEEALAGCSDLEVAACGEPRQAACDDAKQSGPEPSTPPLPIAELKQLAEMAKRFR
jgi:hypothetical protein